MAGGMSDPDVKRSVGIGLGIVALVVVCAGAVPCAGIVAAIAIPNFVAYRARAEGAREVPVEVAPVPEEDPASP